MATTIKTSTFARALVRSGARSVVKRNGGNLLLLYYDGTNAKSLEGSGIAGLASATAVTIVSMNNSSDPAWGHLIGNPAIANDEQFLGYHNGAGSPVRYRYNAGAWSSVASGASGNGFQATHGLIYDSSHYWFQIGYKSSVAATATGSATWISQFGTGDEGYVATPWNGKYLAVTWSGGGVLAYNDNDSVTSPSGVNFPSDTTIESGLTATGTADENVAITTDSNGNAWILYLDNSGMAARYRPAAGGSWSAKTRITSQTSDKSPCIQRDSSGNVYMLWIDGASGNAIKYQKASISASAISLSGSATTLETTSGTPTRNYLHVIEADDTNLIYFWVEGSGSPWTIKANTAALSSDITTTQTQTGTARISASTSKTQTGKSRITATTTKTQTGVASVKNSVTRTQTGTARIEKTATQTITGTARITASASQTQQGVSRITASATKTQTGLARITASTSQTQTGTARVTATTTKTITGTATIQAIGATTQTQTGTARIEKSASQTQTGVALIQKTGTQTLTGVSRITASTSRTQDGTARITATTVRTQTGATRITATTLRTQSGVSRLTITTTRTQSGVARIQEAGAPPPAGTATASATGSFATATVAAASVARATVTPTGTATASATNPS